MAVAMAAAGAVSVAVLGGGLREGGAAKHERRNGLSSLTAASVSGVAGASVRKTVRLTPQFVVFERAVKAQAHIVSVASVIQGEGEKEQVIPMPVVHIDQHTDPDATIVELSFGDRLGALLDTTKALKNLGLNVVKAQVTTEASQAKNRFFITRHDNGNKVENPELLESIRLTIINNLLKYHPESGEQLFLGGVFGDSAKPKIDIDVATHVTVKKVNQKQSLLTVETADRPGLLLDIIKVITDVNIMVESAEIDTEGLVAKDYFNVSYGGAALSKSLEEVLVNCLRYYIRKAEIDEDSY